MSEGEKWWAVGICSLTAILILSITATFIHRDHKAYHLTQEGVDPIAVKCVLDSYHDSGLCLLLTQKLTNKETIND